MARISIPDSQRFFNRHLSWMQFNQRVLEEARDPSNPLLERVKFLGITASNLDEFVEVRLAGLMQQAEHGNSEPGPDGRIPEQVLAELTSKIHGFVHEQYECWRDELVPALEAESVRVLGRTDLRPEAREYIENFYTRTVEPILTPVTVDPAHPFPHVLNKALCLAFLLKRKRRGSQVYLGVVTVPRALPRLVRLPSSKDKVEYAFLHDVVHAFAERLYHGFEILSAAAFRVTRNSNLYLEEEESRSILESVDMQIHRRRKGSAVRLEIEAEANQEIVDRLKANFRLSPGQVFRVNGPINLSRLFHLYEQTPRPDLKYRTFAPRELDLKSGFSSLFELVRKRNVLLHHPYDSYATVVRFIESAAQDPDVLSIKQTLYRTSENSPIVRALIEAAAKKEVAVVVELKARFDEASNIRWARNLQDAGVQVFHGVVGLKTHCKLALIARRESDGQIRRYAHLGTGNYNPSTARFYTDLSLLTSDTRLTSAVHHVFNYLTAHSERSQYSPLFVAPLNLGRNFLGLIDRETAHARAGRPAFVFAKFNSLLDEKIIQALYRASQAGVDIELIVRGACALRPGVRGLSSRIRVRSVIGRFLEHSRIFVFGNAGKTEVFLGSADWMQRNIYERVEVIFRLRDPALCNQIFAEVIAPYLADTLKTRVLQPDGEYVRLHEARHLAHLRNGHRFNVQEFLIDFTEGRENLDSVLRAPAFRKLRLLHSSASESA
ncbi:MAG TPA: polyphosphate kinase 1 [Candidatus Acidoferrales bacterium]|jgi:polyphosphate kinase|nr:polyphosphate kinase 1 [Candidatus Acidoferrales bacterium]